MKKYILTQKLISIEIIGFLIGILFIWLDEFIDIPHHIFGAPDTPVNWREAVFESSILIIICIIAISTTVKLMKQIKYLEGFLPVCSFCKKIRVGKEWVPIEDYISKKSDAKFTHSLCPDCGKIHYKEFFPE